MVRVLNASLQRETGYLFESGGQKNKKDLKSDRENKRKETKIPLDCVKERKITSEWVAWIPALLVVAVIFAFSSQPGDVSKETSGNLTKYLLEIMGIWEEESIYAPTVDVEATDVLVRMLVHMAEYAGLSLAIGFAVTVSGVRGKLRFIYMVILGLFVALADEFYQIFVPGRYGDLADVLFDAVGVTAVAFIVFFMGRLLQKKVCPVAGERKFMNVTLDSISFADAVERIVELTDEKRRYVVTPNVDHIIRVEKDKEFAAIYQKADLVLTDGMPLLWIAESFGAPIVERVTGADLFPAVCGVAAQKKIKMFFLGGGEGVAEKAASNLKRKNPGLEVVGTYAPPIGFEKSEKEIAKIVSIINKKEPDVLVLALGTPKQEKFVYRHRDEMNFGVALCFGAALDFEAGSVKRAPLWIRRIGLEWFYRFLCEPGRLFRRYFVDDMSIFALAWKYRHELCAWKKKGKNMSETEN